MVTMVSGCDNHYLYDKMCNLIMFGNHGNLGCVVCVEGCSSGSLR